MWYHVITLLALCLLADAYKYYQAKIPNGEIVPHPCKPNYKWEGVGHKNARGGGSRNPFGEDFAKNEYVWDRCICERDSDGDGKTNGEELGDPDCVWAEGKLPKRSRDITHPGVCEPVDDPKCKDNNDWSFCEYEEFDCPAISQPEVINVTVRFPETSVPPKETSYFCMNFDLPDDREYHMIASEPIITNKNVMHHIIMAGCTPGDPSDDSWKRTSPEECGMANAQCMERIGLWTLGMVGQCFPPEYGFRVGKNAVKTVSMQMHWNNPEERKDYVDSSGLRLYLTPVLRPNDGAVLVVGTNYLALPPRQELVSQNGYCPSTCTDHLPEKLNFVEVAFHMHYLGHSAKIEHKRGKDVLQMLERKDFDYDLPLRNKIDKLEFSGGDEFHLTCNFNTKKRSKITYYGDATSDEMCAAFLTYYPARKDFTTCINHRSAHFCNPEANGPLKLLNSKCDFSQFGKNIGTILPPLMQKLLAGCSGTAKCPEGCQETVDDIRANEPCLQDLSVASFMESVVLQNLPKGKEFIEMLHSCEPDWDRTIIYRDNLNNDAEDKDDEKSNDTESNDTGKCVFGVKNDVGGDTASGGDVTTSNVTLSVMMLLGLAAWIRHDF